MTTVVYVIVGVGFVFAFSYMVYDFVKNYLKWRGKRLVTCPRDQAPAGVEIDAMLAALTTKKGLVLTECTHWPERQNCGQECLEQIESSPENCLFRHILTNWFKEKACVYCGQNFEEIHWHDHKPALRSPEGDFIEWSQIPVETLQTLLETHKPVCWNCFIAENFRREYPTLVVDRPRRGGHAA
jgi:hypothetical protein